MARHAEQINASRLHERLPVENNEDELGHLARVFNDTLARIEQSFEQLRRFTSDASHELRTPLAAIRSIGEVGLHADTSLEECQDTIGSMLEEVNRLTNLVESLLTLSRADAGQIPMQLTEIPVLQLMREAVSLLEVLIKEKRLTYTVAGDESALVRVDRIFLEQAIVNILHNAVKFTPPGGTISASVSREIGPEVVLAITDSGPGIPADHSAKVFDRFYRVDSARAGESKGVGLGLSIARWVVQAHKGQIDLTTAPGGGCTFSIRLPAA
jgi:signal transduction histidine kinase